MRARFILLLVIVGFLPPALGLAAPAPPAADAPCEGFAVREAIGPSCPVAGGFEVVLPDGARFVTHGPDPVPGHLTGAHFPAQPRAPACVHDPLAERHGLVIYAHPASKPNRGDELRHELQDMVALANGLLHREAVETGAASLDYRMLCESGEVRVDVVTLPFTTGRSNVETLVDYYRIVAALRALGYDNPMAKYWIWYDDPSGCACAGVADAVTDSARNHVNPANAGPNYAITFGYRGVDGAFVMMHENAHNIGAVSNLAPHSSGGGHCNDGLDIMCYADGGSKSDYTSWACRDRIYFDCHHDTYFHARPAAGSYLANRWNIGSPLNRFVQGCLYEERAVVPGALGVGGNAAWIEIPPACRGARFAAMGEHAAPPAASLLYTLAPMQANEVDVCWYAGETLLRCDAKRAFEEGIVPADATRAQLKHVAGPDGRVLLSIV